MKPGELRVFNNWIVVEAGIIPTGNFVLLLEPLDEEPDFYRRWRVLVDGKPEIIDEHTITRFTNEAR
jgi:hypothetical protein